MQYNPGGPGSIVVVRLFYQWPLFVTGLGYNISNLAGNQRLLAATAAFRNEPFISGACPADQLDPDWCNDVDVEDVASGHGFPSAT